MDLAVNIGIILRYSQDASPDTVYRAYTSPKLIPKWWGGRNQSVRVEQMDLRPGGSWRYIVRDENGSEAVVEGIYHEVVPCERLVFSREVEATPKVSMLEIVTFEALDSKTLLTNKVFFRSPEDRESMLNIGFEEELVDRMERLRKLLKTDFWR